MSPSNTKNFNFNKINKVSQFAIGANNNGVQGPQTFEATPIEEIGMGRSERVEDSYTVQSRVEGFYLNTWSWSVETSAGYQQEQTDHVNGLLDLGVTQSLMADGTWDPSNPEAGALDGARVQPRELL